MRSKTVMAVLVFLGFLFSGCATAPKSTGLETQGLRNQVLALETELAAKDEEINSLKEALAKSEKEKEITATEAVKPKPKARQIQLALKNAGYNPGKIDGRIGRQTKDAIRAFQRANNLPVTGKVNEETWDLLKKYLYRKAK